MITREVARSGCACERDRRPAMGIPGHGPGPGREKRDRTGPLADRGEWLPRPRRDGAVLGIALALLLDSLIGHAASLLLFTGLVAAYGWSGGGRSPLAVATLAALAVNDLLPRFPSQGLVSPIALALALAYALEGVLASTLVSA